MCVLHVYASAALRRSSQNSLGGFPYVVNDQRLFLVREYPAPALHISSRPHRIGHRPNAVKLSPSCPLSQAQLNRQPTDKARIIPVGERWHVASWLRDEVPSRLRSVDSVHACVLQVEILPLILRMPS